jgi:hypothetical protein
LIVAFILSLSPLSIYLCPPLPRPSTFNIATMTTMATAVPSRQDLMLLCIVNCRRDYCAAVAADLALVLLLCCFIVDIEIGDRLELIVE